MASRAAVNLYFETGDTPTEAEFNDTWSSVGFLSENDTITGTWDLGTPSAGVLTNCTGYPINILDDSSPQLGANLDVNGFEITGAVYLHSGGDVLLELGDASGVNKVSIRDSAGVEKCYIDSNGNFVTLGSGVVRVKETGIALTQPAYGSFWVKDDTPNRPKFNDDAGSAFYFVLDTATQTLTNKTLTGPTLTAPLLGTPASGILSNCTAYPGDVNLVATGPLNSGWITSGFGNIDIGSSTIDTTGVITGGTVEATSDTSAGDNAAIGYNATQGLILTGQGSVNDLTVKNDAATVVISIPTGGTGVEFAGQVTAPSMLVEGNLVVDTVNFAADAEASDTYAITLSPTLDAYVTGMQVTFTANTANTTGATLNVNGLGAKALTKASSGAINTALATGDILADQVVTAVYDGTQFQVTSRLAD